MKLIILYKFFTCIFQAHCEASLITAHCEASLITALCEASLITALCEASLITADILLNSLKRRI